MAKKKPVKQAKRVVDLKKIREQLVEAHRAMQVRDTEVASRAESLLQLVQRIDDFCADGAACGPDMAIPL